VRSIGAPESRCLVVVSLASILAPLASWLATILPAPTKAIEWRFGAAGLFSESLVPPLVGLLILLWWAYHGRRPGALRLVLGGALLLLAVATAVGTAFTLDFLTLREVVSPAASWTIDRSFLSALASLGLGMLGLATLSMVSVGAIRRSKRSKRG
jgi:hypothetical protein